MVQLWVCVAEEEGQYQCYDRGDAAGELEMVKSCPVGVCEEQDDS